MVFWQERIKILITKVHKKHKNITSLKFQPTITEKRELREVVRKRRKVPLYPYFHPLRFRILRMFLGLVGFCSRVLALWGKTWFNRSETLSHSHQEEEIERGCEEERKGSPVPIFPPPNFGIVRLLTDWMEFCSEVSSMWVERGLFVLNWWESFI